MRKEQMRIKPSVQDRINLVLRILLVLNYPAHLVYWLFELSSTSDILIIIFSCNWAKVWAKCPAKRSPCLPWSRLDRFQPSAFLRCQHLHQWCAWLMRIHSMDSWRHARRLGLKGFPTILTLKTQYCTSKLALKFIYSLCVCVCAVSYTHLTLPTNHRV